MRDWARKTLRAMEHCPAQVHGPLAEHMVFEEQQRPVWLENTGEQREWDPGERCGTRERGAGPRREVQDPGERCGTQERGPLHRSGALCGHNLVVAPVIWEPKEGFWGGGIQRISVAPKSATHCTVNRVQWGTMDQLGYRNPPRRGRSRSPW